MATIMPQIVLFGDSITQYGFLPEMNGWGTSLAHYYARKADVVLRGYSGYNTRWARVMLNKIFPLPSSNPPLLVTVFFGANDAVDPNVKQDITNQHVPLPEYSENLHQIVAHLKKQSDDTHVVLITPPPVSEKNLVTFGKILRGDTSGIPTRRNELTKLYAEQCVKAGEEMGVPVINLFSTFQETPDWEDKLLCDGLHLSAEGNARMFQELVQVLDDQGLVPTVKASDMPWDFPPFSDLGEDPVATLEKWSTPK